MLTSDIYIVTGLVLCGLALPSLFGALADRRSPWVSLAAMGVGAALVALAVSQQPGTYTFAEIPHAFVRVVAAIIR